MLKGSVSTAAAQVAKKVKEGKEAMRREEKKAKESKEAMLQRASTRPMLVESYNTGTYRSNNLAKAKALRNYVDILERNGMS